MRTLTLPSKGPTHMKRLLLASAALVAMTVAGNAAVIQDLGVNPASAQGDFANSVGGATFEDQYTFQLVGGPQFVSIASATNVFTSTTSPDYISNFAGQLFLQVGEIDTNGGDDIGFGLIGALACPGDPEGCQILSGRRLLDPGNYYLELTGTGGGQSGYGGNLTTIQVPGPLAGAGLIPFLGMLGYIGWRRRRAA